MMYKIRFSNAPWRDKNYIPAVSHLLYQELRLILSVTEILITDIMPYDKWIIKDFSHTAYFYCKDNNYNHNNCLCNQLFELYD